MVVWQGDLVAIAAALQTVSEVPIRAGLAMPIALRRLSLNNLHPMGLYFENEGIAANPDDFKAIVPNAFSAEDWFRFHNHYANGEPIVTA